MTPRTGSASVLRHAPIAQLDRAPGFEPGGWGFESLWACLGEGGPPVSEKPTGGPPGKTVKPALLALPPGRLASVLGGPGRARAVYRALRAGHDPFVPGVLPAGLHRRVTHETRPTGLEILLTVPTADGVQRLVFRLEDGRRTEAVRIPEARRTTLCISSQVGCRRGCIFCATATIRPVRHLEADEIVAQVLRARVGVEPGPPIRNLVLMGMGEPLDNPAQVRTALEVLVGPGGLGFGEKHVTVSTVAPSPRAIRQTVDWPARLAWSLHAARDDLRARLVPTARFPVHALRDAFADTLRPRRRALLVEMTLVAGLNDGAEDARAAAALFADFPCEVRFNLLPMNPVAHRALRPSASRDVGSFATILRESGFWVRTRRPRGQDRHAACGQLALAT